MTKSIILLAFIVLASTAKAKDKWKAFDYEFHKDTITVTYKLKSRDSVSTELEKENCNCSTYEDYSGKIHPCLGMIRYFIRVIFWRYEKSVTTYNGKIIRQSIPHYETNTSTASIAQGEYFQNGKYVQPAVIYLKNG